MHALKLAALVAIALGILRGVSWAFGWGIFLARRRTDARGALAANLLGFSAFAACLVLDQRPGEPADPAALAFGAGVYGLYFWVDLKWCPWGRASRPAVHDKAPERPRTEEEH